MLVAFVDIYVNWMGVCLFWNRLVFQCFGRKNNKHLKSSKRMDREFDSRWSNKSLWVVFRLAILGNIFLCVAYTHVNRIKSDEDHKDKNIK